MKLVKFPEIDLKAKDIPSITLRERALYRDVWVFCIVSEDVRKATNKTFILPDWGVLAKS